MGELLAIVAPRISKLIPRLASDSAGEVIATVNAIRRTLTTAGLDLHDLAECISGFQCQARRPQPDSTTDIARWILGNEGGQLNRRERDFVSDIMADAALGIEPSDRQMRWLRAISASLRRRS